MYRTFYISLKNKESPLSHYILLNEISGKIIQKLTPCTAQGDKTIEFCAIGTSCCWPAVGCILQGDCTFELVAMGTSCCWPTAACNGCNAQGDIPLELGAIGTICCLCMTIDAIKSAEEGGTWNNSPCGTKNGLAFVSTSAGGVRVSKGLKFDDGCWCSAVAGCAGCCV